MIARCEYPRHMVFKNYGGRGIRVCDKWRHNFEAFVNDMGPRPAGYSIDRIDNDGNYEPGNCRWASRREQSKNRSDTREIWIDGVKTTTVEIAEKYGLSLGNVFGRYKRGLTGRQIAGLDPLPVKKKASTPAMRAMWAAKKARTHCIHGHEFSPENTIIERDGSRKCRRCGNERRRRKRSVLDAAVVL